MVAIWTSQGLARIKGLYAPSIVGFDYSIDRLVTSRLAWEAAQDAYVLEQLDGATQVERTIQILGPDAFVVSGTWNMTSLAKPRYDEPIRCADVSSRAKLEVGTWSTNIARPFRGDHRYWIMSLDSRVKNDGLKRQARRQEIGLARCSCSKLRCDTAGDDYDV